jgi:hypothetical protein
LPRIRDWDARAYIKRLRRAPSRGSTRCESWWTRWVFDGPLRRQQHPGVGRTRVHDVPIKEYAALHPSSGGRSGGLDCTSVHRGRQEARRRLPQRSRSSAFSLPLFPAWCAVTDGAAKLCELGRSGREGSFWADIQLTHRWKRGGKKAPGFRN